MLASLNITAQLRRVAALKGRLHQASLLVSEPSDELTTTSNA
jgi:hypothetical protein